MPLTHRQMEYFDFIVNFEREHGYPPKIEEIQKHFGLNSPSSVHQKLTELESEGVIRRQKNTHRGIEIVGWPSESEVSAPVLANLGNGELQIPILGVIAAGSPFVPSEDPIGFLSVPSELALSNHYALRIEGESMKDDQIADGDFIVVKDAKGNQPRNGKTVVALIDKSNATVKRFYDERVHIRLQPANDTMAPIIIKPPNRVKIQGIVVGLIRKFK